VFFFYFRVKKQVSKDSKEAQKFLKAEGEKAIAETSQKRPSEGNQSNYH
jgi:hypothetical protein